MPKKRKKYDKRERNLILGIGFVILIIAFIFIVFNYQESKKGQDKQAGRGQGNVLVMSQDNLKFFSSFYLNAGYDRGYCTRDISCQNINGLSVTSSVG